VLTAQKTLLEVLTLVHQSGRLDCWRFQPLLIGQEEKTCWRFNPLLTAQEEELAGAFNPVFTAQEKECAGSLTLY
jgi:hypothetical protein